MAQLVIVNKDRPDIKVKSFNCKITKLCNLVTDYNDVLYHNGDNSFPVNGDVIYKINNISMQYELFNNDTAAIKYISSENVITKYIKTNDFGICTIILCN